MKKIYSGFALALMLILPLSVRAAFDDVTVGDTGVSIVLPGNGNTYTMASTLKVQSFTVNTNSIDVTVLSGSAVTFTSTDLNTFAITGDTACMSSQITCSATASSVIITCGNNDMPHTFTVTPSGTCSSGGGTAGSTGSSGGSSGSSGGSSGGGLPAPAPSQTPSTPAPSTPSVPTPNPALTPAPKPLPPVFQFKKNLVQNSKGNDVVQLQLRLQKLGFFPLKTKANGIMGPTTVASLKKLQTKYKIKENGLGAKTRALLNSLK